MQLYNSLEYFNLKMYFASQCGILVLNTAEYHLSSHMKEEWWQQVEESFQWVSAKRLTDILVELISFCAENGHLNVIVNVILLIQVQWLSSWKCTLMKD